MRGVSFVGIVPDWAAHDPKDGWTSVFEGPRDSETNQVVSPNTSLYKEEVVDLHSASPGCGSHTYLNNGGQLPNSFNSENLSTTPKVASYELTSQERDSALLCYKEKKKTRRLCEERSRKQIKGIELGLRTS
ncbi:hypothetical protein K1719_036543 [Acacia pycnantha]|nr:hypothetical protein K1719_036543 [Acacia pycnantha]